MTEELVRLMLDHWQEHRARRRRELEGARLHVIQQGNEMASAARGARRLGIQPSRNLRAGPRWGKSCIAMQGNGC